MATFGVVIPTLVRPTLETALSSAKWADRVLVVVDSEDPGGRKLCEKYGREIVIYPGDVVRGNANRQVTWATSEMDTDFVLVLCDDDYYLPHAGEIIRSLSSRDRAVIFREHTNIHPHQLWTIPSLYSGNVSACMFSVPKHMTGVWPDPHDGDFLYMEWVSKTFGPPEFRQEVIAYHREG